MILSMTSFARHEHSEEFGTLTWELRSVNHRYLEPTFKMPEITRSAEPQLREILRKTISRGKIECGLRFVKAEGQDESLSVNQELLAQLIKANQGIADHMGSAQTEFASTFLQWPGVLETANIDKEALNDAIYQSFKDALKQLIGHREREGAELETLIRTRLDGILEIVEEVKPLIPQAIQQQREKLINRFEELKLETDKERIESELVVLANKVDVDEELDRLLAHVKEVQGTLTKGSPCGRRLDFLMQELNREANTLGSKSILSQTSQASVSLKVLIEQMREQVQNIE